MEEGDIWSWLPCRVIYHCIADGVGGSRGKADSAEYMPGAGLLYMDAFHQRLENSWYGSSKVYFTGVA